MRKGTALARFNRKTTIPPWKASLSPNRGANVINLHPRLAPHDFFVVAVLCPKMPDWKTMASPATTRRVKIPADPSDRGGPEGPARVGAFLLQFPAKKQQELVIGHTRREEI